VYPVQRTVPNPTSKEMSAPTRIPSCRNLSGRASLIAAVAAVLAGSASAGTVTLNDGQTQNYTPVATGAAGAVDTRTFTGQAQSDASLVNFTGTANSVGTSTNLNIAAQPTTTGTQFLGGLNINTAGTYSFGLNTDDGSRLYIDGVLLINNEGGHGATNLTNSVTLDAGRHEIRIDYVNNSGGGSIAVTYSGPDQVASGAIPSANLFRAENAVSTTVAPNTTTLLNDDIILSPGANATINLSGSAYANAGLNSLNFGAGSILNLTATANRDLRFGSTTFNGAGTYTVFNSLGDVSLGVSTGTAAGAFIVKQGTGRLVLDNSGATANNFTGATFDLQEGTLYAVGRNVTGATNPLGTAIVQLNGGTLALDTAVGDVSFNNRITLAGTGGTIQAVSGPRVMTLSDTNAIAIGAGQNLALNTLGGSNNAAGGTLVLNMPLSGTGTLTKTQTAAGSGTGLGIAALAGDSTSYSGAISVNGGILEGRFATTTAKAFGTNPNITVAAGAGVNLRAGNATSNLTYNVGTNLLAAGNILLGADRYTGTATGSTFAMGTLALSGAGTITMNSGNGHNISFTGTTLGGATTFAVNAGTLTPGPVAGGVGLTKTGAGILDLGPDNAFVGTSNLNGGVVNVPVFADAGPSSIGTGSVTMAGGTLRYTGSANVITNRAFSANNTSGGGLDIAQAGTSFEITSSFAGNTGSVITKSGNGTLILSGTGDNASFILNAQAGLTQLGKTGPAASRAVAGISNIATGATVQLTGSGTDQIYGGSITGNLGLLNMSGGKFDLNGKSESVTRLTGTGTVTNNGANGTISTLTLGETNGAGTFQGAITDGVNGGKVAITKIGTGVAAIGGSANGANSYTGPTTITGGTLRLQAVPTTPVAGTSLWLDAADSSSVVLSSGLVSAWNDKSGNGRNATQVNVANQPGYITNPLVGSQGVIDFNGSQKFLDVNLGFLTGTPYTIFAVEGKQSTAAGNYYIGTRGSTTNNALHIGYRTDTTVTFAQFGNDITTAVNPAYAYTGTQVFRLWTDTLNTTSGRSILLNGVSQGTIPSTATLNVSGGGVIGQGHNTTTQYNGDLGEVIIYNSALSTTDRQTVETYLNWKWFGFGATEQILPASTDVSITASGAALDVNGTNQTIASLSGVDGSAVTLGSGKLTVAGSANTTFAGVISSSGTPTTSFVKQGSGRLVLSGVNTYTGATRVEGGDLVVTGSVSGGATIAGPAAVLSGTGTVGAVTLTNGTLTSGNSSIAPLATGNLALSGGTTLFELAADGSSDNLNVTGTVDFTAPVQLALSYNADLATSTVFTLIANDGADPLSLTAGGGLFAGATALTPGTSFSYTSGGFNEFFEVSYTGGDGNDLTLTVVPEPSAILSILGGLGLLLAPRRRRV
jgi:fibronectin-binding autotransporter adhesin